MTDESHFLLPEHLADLRKSGLNDEIIERMGVYSLRAEDIEKSLGWNPLGVESALAFPYFGNGEFVRLKVFPPQKDKNGHTIKYLQPKSSGSQLYILPAVEPVLHNPSIPLAIGEGEKKSALLLQLGIHTIGVAGIWSWMDGKTHEILDQINKIAWVEREVAFYFDSDIWHRPDLMRPVYAFGKELESRGANVSVTIIEQEGDQKVGVDDFVVERGREAIKDLNTVSLSHRAFSQANGWWKKWKRKTVLVPTEESSNLKCAVHEIRKLPSQVLQSFEKKQEIAGTVTQNLLSKGALYITPEKQGYYFHSESAALFGLDDEEFVRFLADFTGLNPVETEYKFLTEHLRTEVMRRGQKTKVYQLAHYDSSTHRLYVTDFGGGMWMLDGKGVVRGRNGEDGVLFVTTSFADSFAYLPPEERIGDAGVSSFLKQISFDISSKLSPDNWRELVFIWLLSLFFPELHPTKLIPTFIGPQGSTKTTTARRFGIQLLGARFNVGHLEANERGEQSFIAAICGKPLTAFDNADSPIKWLPDRLATYATGHEFELRELYTTNRLSVHKPVAHLILTSRDPHFRRPDVA